MMMHRWRLACTLAIFLCFLIPKCSHFVEGFNAAEVPGRTLGSLSIFPVAIGTLRLVESGGDEGTSAALAAAENLLRAAPPGTLIDTAEIYGGGRTEFILAEAAARAGRTLGSVDLPVATKFAPGPLRFGADAVVEACLASARRLGVNQIDLYQIHFRDIKQPLALLGLRNEKDEAYWNGLAKCYHEGLVANVGVCNYGPDTVRSAHEHLAKRGVPLSSNQINFNLMRSRSSRATKDACDELEVPVLAYHPLGNGALAGKYILDDPDSLPTRSSKRYRMKWYLRNCVPLLDAVGRVAEARGKSCAQVATNWVLCKGGIPIVGPRDAEQLEDSLGATGWSLTSEEVGVLDTASDASAEFERGFELV